MIQAPFVNNEYFDKQSYYIDVDRTLRKPLRNVLNAILKAFYNKKIKGELLENVQKFANALDETKNFQVKKEQYLKELKESSIGNEKLKETIKIKKPTVTLEDAGAYFVENPLKDKALKTLLVWYAQNYLSSLLEAKLENDIKPQLIEKSIDSINDGLDIQWSTDMQSALINQYMCFIQSDIVPTLSDSLRSINWNVSGRDFKLLFDQLYQSIVARLNDDLNELRKKIQSTQKMEMQLFEDDAEDESQRAKDQQQDRKEIQAELAKFKTLIAEWINVRGKQRQEDLWNDFYYPEFVELLEKKQAKLNEAQAYRIPASPVDPAKIALVDVLDESAESFLEQLGNETTEIDLSGQQLTDQQVQNLSQALIRRQKICELVRISLQLQNISDERRYAPFNAVKERLERELAMTAIEAAEMNASDITVLNLSHCNLSAGAARLLAEAFKKEGYLKEIDISHNPKLGDKASSLLSALENHPIEKMRLAQCQLSGNKIQPIYSIVRDSKTLKELDIQGNLVDLALLENAIRSNSGISRVKTLSIRPSLQQAIDNELLSRQVELLVISTERVEGESDETYIERLTNVLNNNILIGRATKIILPFSRFNAQQIKAVVKWLKVYASHIKELEITGHISNVDNAQTLSDFLQQRETRLKVL